MFTSGIIYSIVSLNKYLTNEEKTIMVVINFTRAKDGKDLTFYAEGYDIVQSLDDLTKVHGFAWSQDHENDGPFIVDGSRAEVSMCDNHLV